MNVPFLFYFSMSSTQIINVSWCDNFNIGIFLDIVQAKSFKLYISYNFAWVLLMHTGLDDQVSGHRCVRNIHFKYAFTFKSMFNLV